MMLTWSLLAAAYAADLAFGDPHWLPHPVRLMGVGIHAGEWLLRRLLPWERVAGAVLVVVIVGAGYGLSAWVTHAAARLSPVLGVAATTVLLYTCLSTRALAVEARAVWQALMAPDLPRARTQVARIVGRDTQLLDEPEVVRATVETIAESTLDGILSPLCYAVVGGVPLAVAYKAVNTLDSMIGHRSARYRRFGWAAATVDTWANWLPARLAPAIVAVAARWRGVDGVAAWRCAWRDGAGPRHPVPNAGMPEAAFAGALGVQLGGINRYQGQPVPMPLMGAPRRPLTPARIPEAIRLMYASSWTAFGLAMAALAIRGGGW